MEEIRKQIMETLNFRHACKEFKEDSAISEEDFTVIMEAARLSPSSFGFEPWKILIVQDMLLREKNTACCMGRTKAAPHRKPFFDSACTEAKRNAAGFRVPFGYHTGNSAF